MKTQPIALTLADRQWDGTLERAVALVLDHHLVGAGKSLHQSLFVLRDGDAALIAALVEALRPDPLGGYNPEDLDDMLVNGGAL